MGNTKYFIKYIHQNMAYIMYEMNNMQSIVYELKRKNYTNMIWWKEKKLTYTKRNKISDIKNTTLNLVGGFNPSEK